MAGGKPTKRGRSALMLRTHAEMGKGFRLLGGAGARRTTGGSVLIRLREPPGHKGDIFKRMIAQVATRKLTSESFGTMYRAALGGHDELLSTSSVRELIGGALAEHNQRSLSPKQITEISQVIDNVSRVRLPTKYVGYALSKTDRMQHPTSPGEGLFAESKDTASEHSLHDRARRSAALDAAEEERSKNPFATFEHLARAATRAAIAYTLNEMAAPATAEDVRPFSRVASEADRLDQVRARGHEGCVRRAGRAAGDRRQGRNANAAPDAAVGAAARSNKAAQRQPAAPGAAERARNGVT